MASDLLAQMTTESLDVLLQVVNHDLAPPGGSYIDELDEALQAATDRMQGLGQGQEGFRRGDMVEIQGPAGCGKTELLYFLVLTRALPYRPTLSPRSPTTQRPFATPVLLGGHGQTVLVFSADVSGFSLVRLGALLREYVSGKFTLAAIDRWGELYSAGQRAGWLGVRQAVEAIVREALSRVRVCRIARPDGWALATALSRIEDIVSTELADEDELGLVCVDGFGAAFWPDALAARRAATSAFPTSKAAAPVSFGRSLSALAQSPMYHALDALTHVRQMFSPLVVLTTQLLPGGGIAGRPTTHLPFPYTHPFPAVRTSTALPPVYPAPPPDGLRTITQLITLNLPAPLPIHTQLGFEAVRREQDRRSAEEQKLVVKGIIRVVGDAGREAFWEGRVGGRGLKA